MFEIYKEFQWDMGHRVWKQKLEIPVKPVCRFLHGHRYKVQVHLAARTLNEIGMVTDFLHLTFFKGFINEVLDHTFMFDIEDPILPSILESLNFNEQFSRTVQATIYGFNGNPTILKLRDRDSKLSARSFIEILNEELEQRNGYLVRLYNLEVTEKQPALDDALGGITIVKFVPTAENLAWFFYHFITHHRLLKDTVLKQENNVAITKIVVFETPTSVASYVYP